MDAAEIATAESLVRTGLTPETQAFLPRHQITLNLTAAAPHGGYPAAGMPSDVSAATPARRLEAPLDRGCRVLEHADVGHLDGGEELVGRITSEAHDLSSMSDELGAHDEVWATRYHFARERGHILRGLDLRDDHVVLEVGAGCGAVTRYLGERCEVVDALEPRPERARIARLRTRDLGGVEVFVGGLEAIPAEPAYDLIVLVGVLEYVGGSTGWDERVHFLRQAAARLRDGGTIACAIENQFGAQYLAGAAEEHIARPFVGLEDYPEAGHARTYSRAVLERLFTDAGLVPTVYGVLPDYKFARLVFADSLLDTEARSLAWSVPQFPSHSSPHARPRLVSELHFWRALVRGGLANRTANSFLVLAGAGKPSTLWPAELHAVFFSAGRRSAFATQTRLVGSAGALTLERNKLRPDLSPPAGSMVQRVQEEARWVSGSPLLDVLEECGAGEELASWLRRWRSHVEELLDGADSPANVDLVPHNFVVSDDELVVIDQEWYDATYSASDVVARGLLTCALSLAQRRPPSDWPGSETVRDVVNHVVQASGAQHVENFDALLDREAQLQAHMAGVSLKQQREVLQATLDEPLSNMPLGARETELRARAETDMHGAQGAYANATRRLAEVEARLERERNALSELERAYRTIAESHSWRLTAPLRSAVAGIRRRR